ncbi:MAG: glycosyltransferase [Candidatus Omnitrophota bacterium]|nr:glycosyltransferase [Candidatus Omnitrophota bacterium]
MSPKKVLLLYISEHSGHHCASLAIEKALRALEPSIETMNINSFNYTNPILEKVINRAYMGVVKRTPEIWDYLYDNPKVLKNTQRLRQMIHRFNKGKLKTLLDDFMPDAIVCTQAFPCGMIADYKKTYGLDIPLIGVLTDYAPHSYWIYNNVDLYVVPSDATGAKLIANGIEPSRIGSFGIPIDTRFQSFTDRNMLLARYGLDEDVPCVLIMGGTQGLGPIKEMSRSLDRAYLNLQAVIVTGTNKRLYKWLKGRRFRKKIVALPYADNVNELMEMATVVITKAGGITTAEALAKGVPMLVVNSLPGQEAMNTVFLLSEGVAVRAESPADVEAILEELLYNKNKLKAMSDKARSLARPDSSVNIAKTVLKLIHKR